MAAKALARISRGLGICLQSRRKLTTIQIRDAQTDNKFLKLTFSDGVESRVPFVWLRDNCQCSSCFDHDALARKMHLIDLNMNIMPSKINFKKNKLIVTWSDCHVSAFDADWLSERSVTPSAIKSYKNFHRIEMETWGKDLKMPKFNYEDVMNDESVLLSWLITMEKLGVCLIQRCPDDTEAGPNFIDNIAFVKKTHFGRSSSVKARAHVANLAYRNVKLGLHNDLPYYHYLPGLVFLHMMKQSEGAGGESITSDGQYAVNLLKETKPKEFDILSEYFIFFWDKGIGVNPLEKENFYKIAKAPVIALNAEGALHALRINSQCRFSLMGVPLSLVYPYYEAMLQLNKILYENSISYRLEDGEILVLDNYRCPHGREAFSAETSRHLETSYLDWDEALCTRRCLQRKISEN